MNINNYNNNVPATIITKAETTYILTTTTTSNNINNIENDNKNYYLELLQKERVYSNSLIKKIENLGKELLSLQEQYDKTIDTNNQKQKQQQQQQLLQLQQQQQQHESKSSSNISITKVENVYKLVIRELSKISDDFNLNKVINESDSIDVCFNKLRSSIFDLRNYIIEQKLEKIPNYVKDQRAYYNHCLFCDKDDHNYLSCRNELITTKTQEFHSLINSYEYGFDSSGGGNNNKEKGFDIDTENELKNHKNQNQHILTNHKRPRMEN